MRRRTHTCSSSSSTSSCFCAYRLGEDLRGNASLTTASDNLDSSIGTCLNKAAREHTRVVQGLQTHSHHLPQTIVYYRSKAMRPKSIMCRLLLNNPPPMDRMQRDAYKIERMHTTHTTRYEQMLVLDQVLTARL